MGKYIGTRYRVVLEGSGHVLADGFLNKSEAVAYANSTIFNHWYVERYEGYYFEPNTDPLV